MARPEGKMILMILRLSQHEKMVMKRWEWKTEIDPISGRLRLQ